jgi:heme-degrading monooxygenase HmoA
MTAISERAPIFSGAVVIQATTWGISDTRRGRMIARIWRGHTRADDADVYVNYLRATGVETQRSVEGNLGSLVLRRLESETAEFWVISLWESMEAIERFAGERPEVAVYFPKDEEYLLELEPEVRHYELPVFEIG